MTKQKDTVALNGMILELAKVDIWLSREEIKERTGKPITTIKRYMDNDLKELIEKKDFIEYKKRNTGKGKTNIEKYKLISGLDNLLKIFNVITDKSTRKEIMRTNYFESQKPLLINKLSEVIKNYKITEISNILFTSPTAVFLFLKISPTEIMEIPRMPQTTKKIAESIAEKLNLPQDMYNTIMESIDLDLNDFEGNFVQGVCYVAFADNLDKTDSNQLNPKLRNSL